MDEESRKRALSDYIEARVNLLPSITRVTEGFAVVALPLAFYWPDFFEAMSEIGWEFVFVNGALAMFRKAR